MSSPRFAQWRPHPWHGLPVGPAAPERVFAFIEMTPLDPVKYEIDKETGYLRVDRPQRTSSLTHRPDVDLGTGRDDDPERRHQRELSGIERVVVLDVDASAREVHWGTRSLPPPATP